MLDVCGSMSTKTGVAPVYRIAATVAINIKGMVMTSSPGPTPAASKGQTQHTRARIDGDRGLGPAIGREFFFECGDFWAKCELTTGEDPQCRLVELSLD